MSPEDQALFRRVLWIAGGTDSGKTTIADRVAQRHGLAVYHFDRHEPDHFERADPDHHPELWRGHPDRMRPDERWLSYPPQEMACYAIASWTERFDLALEDLRALPTHGAIVAEGVGFFPEVLAPKTPDARRAVWLVPSESFKRESVSRRQKLSTVEVSDRERAVTNLIARDLLINEHIRSEATARGLALFEVDGSRDLDEMTELVEVRFRSALSG